MMKIIMMVFCVLMVQFQSYGFTEVTWGSGGWTAADGTWSLTDSAGNNLTTNSGLLFQLVVDVDGDTDFASMLSDGYWFVDAENGSTATYNTDDDRTYIGSQWTGLWTGWSTGGGLFDSGSSRSADGMYTNVDFYFRWFIGSTVGASEAGLIYSTADSWQTGDGLGTVPSVNLAYSGGSANMGGSTGTYTGWSGGTDGWATMVPIPEPGTIFLMGIGAAAVLARKRFRK